MIVYNFVHSTVPCLYRKCLGIVSILVVFSLILSDQV